MKRVLFVLLALVYGGLSTQAQSNQVQLVKGMLSSEVKADFADNALFLVFKEYANITAKERSRISAKGQLTYADLPLEATNVITTGDLFTSKLLCFENGAVKWTKEIGKTNSSFATALAVDTDGTAYSGEKSEDMEKVTIYKYGKDGKLLWSATLDSLRTVHEIFVDNKPIVTALVSSTLRERINHGNTFSFRDKFIYQTVTLDKSSGKVIKKKFNPGPTYFCSVGFSDPTLHSHSVNYFYRGDTLIYSRNDTLQMMNPSAEKLSDHDIKGVVSDESMFVALARSRATGKFKLVSNDWSGSERKESQLELGIAKDAAIVKLLKDKAGNIILFYSQDNKLWALVADKLLQNRISNTAIDSKYLDGYLSEIVPDNSGNMLFIFAKKTKDSRSISLGKYSLK